VKLGHDQAIRVVQSDGIFVESRMLRHPGCDQAVTTNGYETGIGKVQRIPVSIMYRPLLVELEGSPPTAIANDGFPSNTSLKVVQIDYLHCQGKPRN
jgi:hypothetical protein